MAGRKQKAKRAKRAGAKSANISQLARATKMGRATIARRLAAAQIKPQTKKPNEKLYDAEKALRVLNAEQSAISEARRQKITVEAARSTLKLQQERGELLDANEVRNVLQAIFSRLFQQLAIQHPRDNKARLHRLKTAEQLGSALKHDVSQVFNDLRADFAKFIGEGSKQRSAQTE